MLAGWTAVVLPPQPRRHTAASIPLSASSTMPPCCASATISRGKERWCKMTWSSCGRLGVARV